MRLTSFQVKDFRSVTDSTPIRVEDGRTVLVGRNESGKSSLLRALHSLRPSAANPIPTWGLARDFPRGRRRAEFRDDIVMLVTTWHLEDADQAELAKLYPRSKGVTEIEISRTYAPKRIVALKTTQTLSDVASPGIALSATLSSEITQALAEVPVAVSTALNAVTTALSQPVESPAWGKAVVPTIPPLRAALAAAQVPQAGAQQLTAIEAAATAVADDDAKRAAAIAWIESQIPIFVYLDDWDFVPGHCNMKEYLERMQPGKERTNDDKLFEKMTKVAELDAKELQQLLGAQHEERTLLTDRASNVVTTTLERLWKDREITVQFRVDGDHFDVIVKDRDSNALVPLDERSRGFRWYFSFFLTFAADTQGGPMHKAILLLDEPGLFLHALAQEALLDFFRDDLSNLIIYTTHSPFMIRPSELTSVRTVNLDRAKGTTASADPAGDPSTLFPLQAALGYNLTQTMFIGTDNVVVEGVTDYWYLTAASDYLKDSGAGFPTSVALTPAGGAGKVGYMVALLAAQKLTVVVLLDSDGAGDAAAHDLVTSKLARSGSILRVGSVLSPAREADIEDLLEPDVFETLARQAYTADLKGKKLVLNTKVPRIVPRFEQAFTALGLTFNKTRVAKLFLQKMASADAATVFPATTEERFKNLIASLTQAVDRLKNSGHKPFQT